MKPYPLNLYILFDDHGDQVQEAQTVFYDALGPTATFNLRGRHSFRLDKILLFFLALRKSKDAQ